MLLPALNSGRRTASAGPNMTSQDDYHPEHAANIVVRLTENPGVGLRPRHGSTVRLEMSDGS